MRDVNRITVCRENFKDFAEFENAIKRAIMVLLENDYILTIRYDEPEYGIVTIDYNYADASYGCHYPYWLSPEEYESINFEEV